MQQNIADELDKPGEKIQAEEDAVIIPTSHHSWVTHRLNLVPLGLSALSILQHKFSLRISS